MSNSLLLDLLELYLLLLLIVVELDGNYIEPLSLIMKIYKLMLDICFTIDG